MVFKRQSLLPACLFGFACLHASDGFRIEKHTHAQKAHGSEMASSSLTAPENTPPSHPAEVSEHQSLLHRSETQTAAQQTASLNEVLKRKGGPSPEEEAAEKRRREAEAARRRAEQERRRREEEAEKERRRREAEQKRKAEEERRRREAEEKRAAEEAEEKRRAEEAEKKRIEEEKRAAELERQKMLEPPEGCPSQLILNTKGDCLDGATNEVPAVADCCKTCSDTIKGAEGEYRQGIEAYMSTCKLTRDDVNPLNTDKICSEECQALSMEQALLDIDYSDLSLACSRHPPATIKPLERTALLLETLHTAWVECRKPPETTTLEPTTITTTELTTTEAYRFAPVEIHGWTREWRLIRDSSSVSAGLGVDKHEAYISVTPPGIDIDPTSLETSSTGSLNLLNVKHAVIGGEALRLDVEALAQYGSHQGKGRFMKDVQLRVTRNKVDFPHVMWANVKAVEAISHGDSTDPIASVALLVDVKAEGRILFSIQEWKRSFKFIFWGNGHIQLYIV